MDSCNHHYEFRKGSFVCRNCGNVRVSRYKNRRMIRRISILAGVLILGFFIYQNYVATGILEIESSNSLNNIRTITQTQNQTIMPITAEIKQVFNSSLNTVSKAVSQTGDQLNLDPMKTKPIINMPILEQKIHNLINVQRVKNQLNPLIFDPRLTVIARNHSQDMATRNYFEHDTPEGVSFSDRYKQAGYICEKRFDVTASSYSIMEGGENIFQNNLYNSYETINGVISHYDWNDMDKIASTTVNGWMNSSGHRHNILTSEFDSEGIGVATSSDDKVYITEDFC